MTRKKALSGLSATSFASLNLGVTGRYTGAVLVAAVVAAAAAAVAAVAEEGAAAMLAGREGRKEGYQIMIRVRVSSTSTSTVLVRVPGPE